MSSSICHHFTQNAWKKDLCSNCFKSKDEHKQAAAAAAAAALKYAALKTSNTNTTQFTTTVQTATNKMDSQNAHQQKTDYPNKNKKPAKSIIKKLQGVAAKSSSSSNSASSHKHSKPLRVCFPKQLSEVIGYGGEWSDNDSEDDDDFDFVNIGNERDDLAATSTDDEETIEIKRITRANTDFNMNNGNLLGNAEENIKKSFAALKLGAPQVDKEGKKQTLKINVVPFGAGSSVVDIVSTKKPATTISSSITSTASNVKAKFESKTKEPAQPQLLTAVKVSKQTAAAAKPTSVTVTKSTPVLIASRSTASSTSTTTATTILSSSATNASTSSIACSNDGKNSPPIERAMEKSLLDEISETLEKQNKQKQTESQTATAEAKQPSSSTTITATSTSSSSASSANNKIKFEISSLSDTLENKTFLELKKPIARNAPITKDHAKPKVNVFHKYSDTDSNCSDSENGVSAYYDVVETNTEISYENLPDGKYNNVTLNNSQSKSTSEEQKSVYSSSQYITDMLLSSKTRAASYNLHEGNFMTSKITSDGLIVTKCSSDDALDSTGSSFDGSSDEETSYNMIRSESDSGIGISIGSNEYKNVNVIKQRIEKKLSASTNNSDYEDIQIGDQAPALPSKGARTQAALKDKPKFSLEKSRELHGEPDGSADPDGNAESQQQQQQQQQQQSTTQLPSLPKSPPPTKTIDARPSFLHGLQKQQQPPMLLKKPDLPAKPLVSPVAHGSPLKTFINKRMATTSSTTNDQQQQVIQQLQHVMTKQQQQQQQQGNNESQQHESQADSSARDDLKLKKGKAPNPPPESPKATNSGSSAPPTPERDYSMSLEFETAAKRIEQTAEAAEPKNDASETKLEDSNANKSTTTTSTASSHYTRNLNLNSTQQKQHQSESLSGGSGGGSLSKASSPVIREKDKRERATINPKFRSLNTFVMQRTQAVKNMQLQNASSTYNLKQSLTPEPTPRNHKNLSLSQECLADTAAASSNAKTSHKSITASIPNLILATTQEPKKPSTVSSSFFSATFSPTVHSSSSITLAQPQQKQKAKFSIKKFLRMGTHSTSSKSADNLTKKDSIYSEICTGDDGSVIGKPRLVIIHPIDINPTAVEVVKDITKTNDAVAAQTVAVNVANKPPAPPQRLSDAQRNAGGNGGSEANKPARPPPPKSAELRRKQQKLSTLDMAEGSTNTAKSTASSCGSLKCKSDNVYANLGEIRSSIAPRKPERTASMREREAQLELARKRHGRNENADTASICSSNGITSDQQEQTLTTTAMQQNSNNNTLEKHTVDGKPPSVGGGSRTSTFEKIKKNDAKIMLSNKLELFEQRDSAAEQQANVEGSLSGSRPSSLKDSVRKINCTIDSYLKDKREFENMYEMVKSPASPPPPPARSSVSEYNLKTSGGASKNESGSGAVVSSAAAAQRRRNQLFSDTASLASYTRSEYAPTTQNRGYGFHNSLANIPRIISASYCGSEVGEFDIYAPYSYYGSETGGDVANDINDSVWGMPSTTKNRLKATNRLRMRKGRSVVHKNIEDNYTAVVVANHEALAQVLDQLQQTPIIPPALRPLANAINLRFEDFNIIDGAQAFVVGKKAFHAAVWTSAPVTLALSADCNQLAGVGGELNQLSGGVSGVLNPITEFCDLVPSYHLPLMPSTEVQMLQATISVLPRLQLDTLQTIGAILKGKSQVLDKSNFNFRGSIPNLSGGIKELGGSALRNVVSVQNLSTLNEESSLDLKQQQQQSNDASVNATNMPAFDDVMTREVAFIMLQLVNGMKHLQVKAIEEMPLSLSNVVLSKDMDNKDAQARLCVLQGNNNDEDEPMGTLCKCAHIALTEMLPTTKITSIVGNILQQERAESLSKVKSVLEFVLWGPSDVTLTGSVKERELALQRWLDLERATVLHGLVRTRVELTVYDECHLMFLVRSTAKIMNDAAKIVCSYQQSVDGKTQSGSLKEE